VQDRASQAWGDTKNKAGSVLEDAQEKGSRAWNETQRKAEQAGDKLQGKE